MPEIRNVPHALMVAVGLITAVFVAFSAWFHEYILTKVTAASTSGRGAAERCYKPGFHIKLPITTLKEVQGLCKQTRSRIFLGSGGVLINFGKVEVMNRLREDYVLETVRNYTTDYDKTWIFDKIHHEINQFCSGHTLQEVYITLFDTLDESLQTALQRDCLRCSITIASSNNPEFRNKFVATRKMEAEKTQLLRLSLRKLSRGRDRQIKGNNSGKKTET